MVSVENDRAPGRCTIAKMVKIPKNERRLKNSDDLPVDVYSIKFHPFEAETRFRWNVRTANSNFHLTSALDGESFVSCSLCSEIRTYVDT